MREFIMTGSNEGFGIADKAVDLVESAGTKVGDVVGKEHIVVKKTKKAWQYFLLYPAVFGVLLGIIPTAMNIYKSLKYGIDVSEVAHAEEQKTLWIKNLHCVKNLTYHTVQTNAGDTVQIGACQNGDVLIELIPQTGEPQVAEWVSLDRAKAAAGMLGSLLFSPAFAAGSGAATIAGGTGKVKTICTTINPSKETIERIVKRGAQCTREVNNMMTRKSIKREKVPCNTKCTPM